MRNPRILCGCLCASLCSEDAAPSRPPVAIRQPRAIFYVEGAPAQATLASQAPSLALKPAWGLKPLKLELLFGWAFSALAHYEVLGITEDADAEQVRRAFRRAARTLHPDVNHAPDATQRFQAALAAYEALTDADSRQHYDTGLGLVSARAKDPRFARFERWRTEVVPPAVVQIRLEEWGVEVAGIVAGWEASLANLAAQCREADLAYQVALAAQPAGAPGTNTSGQGRPGQADHWPPLSQT
ncbi:hypothetical protein QJQ45_018109, partial [Haematococcus lacustris]